MLQCDILSRANRWTSSTTFTPYCPLLNELGSHHRCFLRIRLHLFPSTESSFSSFLPPTVDEDDDDGCEGDQQDHNEEYHCHSTVTVVIACINFSCSEGLLTLDCDRSSLHLFVKFYLSGDNSHHWLRLFWFRLFFGLNWFDFSYYRLWFWLFRFDNNFFFFFLFFLLLFDHDCYKLVLGLQPKTGFCQVVRRSCVYENFVWVAHSDAV